jgi:acyl-ACP thioesterase
MRPDDHTLTPEDIAKGYQRSYCALHGRTPRVIHMGGYWYKVNGEIVHRSTLIDETLRLKQIQREQKRARPAKVEKSIVQRLIARLRAI